MFEVDGTSLRLTRGDTAYLKVTIQGYTVKDGDILHFSVKKNTKKETPYLIHKTIEPFKTTVVTLGHSDTKALAYGSYVYDIQLSTVNGEVFTIVEPSSFKLLEEVTVDD